MGTERRQHLPGRTLARTTFLPASGARLGAVSHAHQESLHVRIGHASRRRHYGRQRTPVGARNSERRKGGIRPCPKRAMSSSSGAGTTVWLPPFISLKQDSNRWYSNAAPKWAERPSQKNFIPASAAPRWRITPARCAP